MCLLLNEAKKNDPYISCFRRTDSLNQGWIVRCRLAWEKKIDPNGVRILARRSSRGHVTNWAVQHLSKRCAFFDDNPGVANETTLLATQKQAFSEQVWVQLWLLFAVAERNHAVPGYKRLLCKTHTTVCAEHNSWLNAAESDSVLWFEYFIKSDTWFD